MNKKENLLSNELEKIKSILDKNPVLKKRVLAKINEFKDDEAKNESEKESLTLKNKEKTNKKRRK